MRAFRLLALAAALVVPAAAAHAQYGVYVGPTAGYAGAWVPGHWDYNAYGRFWVPAHPVAGYYAPYRHDWRFDHDGDRHWDRGYDRDRDHDRRHDRW
jgi:hypothetical protein